MSEYEVPTLKEEIDRKAIETIESVLRARVNGSITEQQYSYAVDLIWSLFSGIAGNDFTGILEQMDSQKKEKIFVTQMVFAKNGSTVVVRNLHNGMVITTTLKNGNNVPSQNLKDFRDEIGGTKKALQTFEEICKSLTRMGFTKL